MSVSVCVCVCVCVCMHINAYVCILYTYVYIYIPYLICICDHLLHLFARFIFIMYVYSFLSCQGWLFGKFIHPFMGMHLLRYSFLDQFYLFFPVHPLRNIPYVYVTVIPSPKLLGPSRIVALYHPPPLSLGTKNQVSQSMG